MTGVMRSCLTICAAQVETAAVADVLAAQRRATDAVNDMKRAQNEVVLIEAELVEARKDKALAEQWQRKYERERHTTHQLQLELNALEVRNGPAPRLFFIGGLSGSCCDCLDV